MSGNSIANKRFLLFVMLTEMKADERPTGRDNRDFAGEVTVAETAQRRGDSFCLLIRFDICLLFAREIRSDSF